MYLLNLDLFTGLIQCGVVFKIWLGHSVILAMKNMGQCSSFPSSLLIIISEVIEDTKCTIKNQKYDAAEWLVPC